MLTLVLYGRRNCHLCDVAKAAVQRLQQRLDFEVEERESIFRRRRSSFVNTARRSAKRSAGIANSMFAQLGKLARESRWSGRIETAKLTARELDVLRLIADDRLSNKQIARKLSLSLYTVKNHVHNILEKLQVENRYEAAEYAYEQHLLK